MVPININLWVDVQLEMFMNSLFSYKTKLIVMSYEVLARHI